MNKVKVLTKIDLLLEGEMASRFYSKIRLAVEKEELEGRKRSIDCLYWPRNVILRDKLNESLFRKKGIQTNVRIEGFDIYVISKIKYNELREGEDKLAYTRFSNLRNYFLIKRLQSLSEEEKKRLKVSFAIRETEIERKVDYYVDDKIVREWQPIEEGEWVFNGERGFMTKIPAFFGSLLFTELRMFRGRKISIKDRQEVNSNNNTDDRSISTRFVINQDERSLYNKAAELTYNNLRKLVNDKVLLEKCKKYLRKYNKVKTGI